MDDLDVVSQMQQQTRRRQLLDAMMQQNMQQPIQGRGGIAQALAKVAAAYMGSKQQGKLDQADQSTRQQYNGQLGDEVAKYMAMRQGSPGGQPLPGPQPEAMQDQPLVTQPTQGDPRAAILQAMTSRLPEMQGLGKMELTNLGKQEQESFSNPVTEKGPNGQLVQVQYGNRGTRRVVPGATPFEKPLVVNDQLVDPSTAPGTDFRTKWKSPNTIGGDLYQQEDRPGGGLKKLDNAPRITVSPQTTIVNKGETAFTEALGKDVAGQFKEARAAASQGYSTLGTVKQLKELDSKGVFSGPTSNVATTVGAFAQSMGMKVDQAKLANSEAYQQQFSKEVAKVLMAGSGVGRSMTDADRKRFEDSLPSLLKSPSGRSQIYRMMESDAQNAIKRHQSFQQQLVRQYPDHAGMLTMNPVDEAPGMGVSPNEVPTVPGLTGGSQQNPLRRGW